MATKKATRRVSKVDPNETPRDRFERVGGARVGNALAKIGLLGNINNTRSYEYSEIDIEKIEGALNVAVDTALSAMRAGLAKKDKKEGGKPGFTF